MPEPITITEQETPALSPENQEMLQALEQQQETSESLLAGKYKSVEELEKGYRELQAKLSGKQPAPVEDDAETPEPEEGEDTEEKPEAAGNAREVYGDVIGGRLEEAGIDFQTMSDRWAQSGQLEDGDYDQLQEAGFTRDMVDAYLAGLNYKAAQDSQLAVKEIAAIKQEYGGDAQYSAMIEWASSNLPKAEVDAFNQVVSSQSLDVVKLAVAGLHARYTAAEGREPKLLSGRAAKGGDDRFESTAQLVEAMKDPRYASDPAYRKKIEARLAKSSIM